MTARRHCTESSPTRRIRSVALGVLVAIAAVSATSAAQAATPVSYKDFAYTTALNPGPTGDKPQSKLWFNDGIWWGVLLNPADQTFHVYKLVNHAWVSTPTVVDTHPSSRADVTLDGSKLYVVSRLGGAANSFARLTYDTAAKLWRMDTGFPKTFALGGIESITADRDSKGTLWVTYTRTSKVWLTYSTDSGATWAAPFNPPVADTTVTADDISALVAIKPTATTPGKIGVMWSNQVSKKMRFTTHKDGDPATTWSAVEDALPGIGLAADDHINLKNVDASTDGRVFAAVKSSETLASAGRVRLLRRDATGTWTNYVHSVVSDSTTRPMLLLDDASRDVYFFVTGPEAGGTIYYKKTSMASPSFGPGRGAPFVQFAGAAINNATSTKQSVNPTRGIVVLASAENTNTYYHGELSLGATTPPAAAQCGDGIDNDGDGKIDFPADPGCTSATDTTESPDPTPPPAAAQCGDGIDNDGDGKIDFPADPGCTSATDTTESPDPTVATQCSDGVDNDGDGKIDFPTDPGCSSATDTTESPDPTPPPPGAGSTVSVSTATLTIASATGAKSTMTVSSTSGTYTIQDTTAPLTAGAGCSQVSSGEVSCVQGATAITAVKATLGDLDDTFTATTSTAVQPTGGTGNDTITGGPGNDTILGGAGTDNLAGGGGNDLFNDDAAANGADVFDGGAGTDQLNYTSRTGDVVVTLDDVANDGADANADGVAEEGDNVGASIEKVSSGGGNDHLTGNDLANTLTGNLGNDVLTGGGGADSLVGGDGDDTLFARDGIKDTVNCGNGTDGAQTDALDVLTTCETAL